MSTVNYNVPEDLKITAYEHAREVLNEDEWSMNRDVIVFNSEDVARKFAESFNRMLGL